MSRLFIRLALLTALLVIASGCVVLPVPNYRIEGHGVASRIIEAESGRPIAGATVVDANDERRSVTTNEDGRFILDPHVRWHFGYLWGVISYPIWPFTGDVVIPHRVLRVTADGYDEMTFTLSPSREGERLHPGIALNDDVLTIPSLPLSPRPTTRPADPRN